MRLLRILLALAWPQDVFESIMIHQIARCTSQKQDLVADVPLAMAEIQIQDEVLVRHGSLRARASHEFKLGHQHPSQCCFQVHHLATTPHAQRDIDEACEVWVDQAEGLLVYSIEHVHMAMHH